MELKPLNQRAICLRLPLTVEKSLLYMIQKTVEVPDGLETHGANMHARHARYRIGNCPNIPQRYSQIRKRNDKEEEGWRWYFQKPSRFVWQSLG